MAADGPLLPRYLALGVPLVRVGINRGLWHPSALAAGWSFVRELRRRRIQLLQAHDIYTNIFALPWARIAGVPAIVGARRWHDAVPSRAHALANRIASRLASRVLANSAAVARVVEREDGVPAARIHVEPNFLDPSAFDPLAPVERARRLEDFGIPPDARVIGVVARLSAVKDHGTFLRALAVVRSRVPNVRGLIMGDGPERPRLESLASELGLADAVHFAGEVPHHPNPHSLLDISVLTSTTEGFPNTIIEAMAAGAPVVATRVGGVPDAVIEGETGLLVAPGNVEGVASAVLRILDSPDEAVEMGEAGRRRAFEKYHRDVVLPSLVAWYESLLPGS